MVKKALKGKQDINLKSLRGVGISSVGNSCATPSMARHASPGKSGKTPAQHIKVIRDTARSSRQDEDRYELALTRLHPWVFLIYDVDTTLAPHHTVVFVALFR